MNNITKRKKADLSAQDFVDLLLTEGAKVTCDETNENFVKNDRIPPFYDERLFRKGQEFYKKHSFSMIAAKFFGLISVLAIPTILKILIFTKMSSSVLTAYKRYVATVYHMAVWYDNDFKPGSKLWNSISKVRDLHNSASKRGSRAGVHRIFQKDMVLTQFGFMAYQLVRSEAVGIHDATEEEWQAFLHVWRVVGYLMGIEDRFNLCSGTVQETREICNLLIDQVYRPEIEKRDEDFLTMTRYLCAGLWAMNPVLRFKTAMCILHNLVQKQNGVRKVPEPTYFKLSWGLKLNYYYQVYVLLYLMPFYYYRLYRNCVQDVSLWLSRVFPFLAMYKFGLRHAYVDIKV